MILERFYPTQESRMARTPSCNFIGHLENEKTACISLTGCASSDDLHFTINSKNSGSSNMYILHKDGHLELVESAFKVCSYLIIFQIYWWGFSKRYSPSQSAHTFLEYQVSLIFFRIWTFFSMSQTDPCFQNKNSRCRLTGQFSCLSGPQTLV